MQPVSHFAYESIEGAWQSLSDSLGLWIPADYAHLLNLPTCCAYSSTQQCSYRGSSPTCGQIVSSASVGGRPCVSNAVDF